MLSKSPALATRNDDWKKIKVVPDLTEKQRKEDNAAYELAKENNEKMSDDDSKNFQWKVVGQRGYKKAVRARKFQEGAEQPSGDKDQKKRKKPTS